MTKEKLEKVEQCMQMLCDLETTYSGFESIHAFKNQYGMQLHQRTIGDTQDVEVYEIFGGGKITVKRNHV